jgi:hypothetical protein
VVAVGLAELALVLRTIVVMMTTAVTALAPVSASRFRRRFVNLSDLINLIKRVCIHLSLSLAVRRGSLRKP